jgi:O-antigen biosynthesis protein
MKQISVSVVIPNWNGRFLLEKHLKGVIEAVNNAEIIITDDHSTDDSIPFLKNNYPHVILVQSDRQTGFSANINRGVSHATGDIVVLLNTDVEPQKDFLKPLLKHFSDPKIFAVGCLDHSYEKGQIYYRGRGVACWKKGLYVHERGNVDKTDTAWVSGGSGAFSREYWNKLGGMDELFNPFYWEDIDLSYRAKLKGYQTIFEPTSIVHHYHEEGKIKSIYSVSDIAKIAYRNQFIFTWKHIPSMKILGEHLIYVPYQVIKSAISGDFLMLWGALMALTKLPAILKYRIYRN